MKIWIDLTNSPHINFFKPFIDKWEKEGNEVIITARNLANTIDLIKQNGWKYFEIGGHAGRAKIKKFLYFPKRVYLLWKFLRGKNLDIGISHSSFYSPLVSKLLNIPSIYINDNEHAKGNYLAFKFATENLMPEFLIKRAKEQKWTKKFNLDFYPGIKEGIYLSFLNTSTFKKNHSKTQKTIYIRLEPWTAQYYSGKHNFMDDLILELKKEFNIIVLPRGEIQSIHYKEEKFKGINVLNKPIKLEKIYSTCDLFIGAGGSMTRELAFLGIPTISVYQDELLEVDKYLIENNYLFYNPNPVKKYVIRVLKEFSPGNNTELKIKGKKAFSQICKKIELYGKNKDSHNRYGKNGNNPLFNN